MRFLILSVLISLHSITGAAQEDLSRDGGAYCVQCSSGSYSQDNSMMQYNTLGNIAVQTGLGIFGINKELGFADRCIDFADEVGLGKWGNFIVEEMTPDRYPDLYNGSDDLSKLCPNYQNLNEKKSLVWVVILNAMAHLESSCNPSETAKGPYSTAKGLLQLPVGLEQEQAPGCQKGDAQSTEKTLRCGLSILNKQLFDTRLLFEDDAHWEVLRENVYRRVRTKDGVKKIHLEKYKTVQSAIESYELCKIK